MDIQAGNRASCRTILIKKERKEENLMGDKKPEMMTSGLLKASQILYVV